MSEISIATPVSDGDVLSWPITSTITAAVTNLTNLVSLPHTKAGQWPIAYPLAPDQQVEGNMWGVFKINGSWVAGTIDWLRPGQFEKTLDPTQYGPGFKTVYESYTGPKPGETVGYFVSTLARFGNRTSNERSNIVWLAYGTSTVVPSPIAETPIPVPIPVPVPVPTTPNDTVLLMQILGELKVQTEIFKLIGAGLKELPAQINETFSKGVKIRF